MAIIIFYIVIQKLVSFAKVFKICDLSSTTTYKITKEFFILYYYYTKVLYIVCIFDLK